MTTTTPTLTFDRIVKNAKGLPTEPGCYLMKDARGKIFYVGKAINLRNRVANYFTGQDKRPFVQWLGGLLARIDTIVVRNEVEALVLERSLIRQHKPRFNILLRDDSNYLMLQLQHPSSDPNAPLPQRYPRLRITRQAKPDGAYTFGPYPNASALRKLARFVNKHFQLRTCSDRTLQARVRPCLQFQMQRCPAPCCYQVPNYGEETKHLTLFLNGKINHVCRLLQRKMERSADDGEFEQAARLRDHIAAIRASIVDQAIVAPGNAKNRDVITLARSGPCLEIAQLTVRGGHPVGTTNHSFSGQEFPSPELLASFLTQRYAATSPAQLPDDIILGVDLGQDSVALAQHLSERRGKRVHVRVPARGQTVKLLQICQKNADCALQSRLKQQDLARDCLERLRTLLGLAKTPHCIECFDVSLFQGSDPMASQVCFVDGVPAKARYRLFHVKTVQGTDDYAMLHEVLLRRLKRGLRDDDLPDLLLVDGGKGQLGVALAACKDLGIAVNKRDFYVAGIAKARPLRGFGAEGPLFPNVPVTQNISRDSGYGGQTKNPIELAGSRHPLAKPQVCPEEQRNKPDERSEKEASAKYGNKAIPACAKTSLAGKKGSPHRPDTRVCHPCESKDSSPVLHSRSGQTQDDKNDSLVTSANGDSSRPNDTDINAEDLIKRSPERLFVPGVKDPIVLRSHTPERYLVERIRDEAHRFAITAHRAKRKRRTLTSALDTIPGVGPARRRLLLKHLGSLAAVRQASTEALGQVPGIGPELAKQIVKAIASNQSGGATEQR